MKRTTYAGLVSKDMVGEEIVVKGWVQRRRDLGSLIFLDIRDREGIVQIVVDKDDDIETWQKADDLRSEYVVEIRGEVVERDEETFNPEIETGEVEITAEEINVLNTSKTPPFQIDSNEEISEDVRGHYRYLDLRREKMQENIMMRHRLTKAVRDFLDEEAFLDIETPYLTKSTPEGARDYLVPSRIHEGYFYALPQSPQLFKQLLMGAGFDRYYQIVRCFRDEDLRGDRQPEFTQIDIETSFIDDKEIQEIIENMLQYIMKEVKGIDIEIPFERMTYDHAMTHYGTDKPDLRFDMPLIDLTETVEESSFKVFSSTVEKGGIVKALNVKGAAEKYTRKDIDALTEFAAIYEAKGLAWMKITEEGITGPIAKFFNKTEVGEGIIAKTDAEPGDLLLFVADKESVVHDALGALRTRLGKELELYDEEEFNFVWIVEWPLLEYDEDEKRYTAAHHPFTMPVAEDIDRLLEDPESVYANAYDIVLNGYEIGGGSLRIHDRELQEKMFEALGFTEREYTEQFGFLLDALDYGFPPHGGIAFGLDRLAMILAGENNIREVIAFPKNNRAVDPLSNAPSKVDESQLEELGLEFTDEGE